MATVKFIVGLDFTKDYEVEADLVWKDDLPQHYFGETIYNMLNILGQESQEIPLPIATINEFDSIIEYARLQRDYQNNSTEYQLIISAFLTDLFSIETIDSIRTLRYQETMVYIVNFLHLADYLEIQSLLDYGINYFAQLIRKLIIKYPSNFLRKIAKACTYQLLPVNLLPDIYTQVVSILNAEELSGFLLGIHQFDQRHEIWQMVKPTLSTLLTTKVTVDDDDNISYQMMLGNDEVRHYPNIPYTVNIKSIAVCNSDNILCIARVPNSNLLVGGLFTGLIKVWNLDNGQQVMVLTAGTDLVQAVSCDSWRIVSGSSDKTVRVWNINNGQQLLQLHGHTKDVYAVTISADGRIVSGSDDRSVRVWDINTGQQLLQLNGHTDGVTSVAVSNNYIISGSYDGSVRVWDLNTGLQLMVSIHSDSVLSVAANSRRIVSGNLQVWNIETRQQLMQLPNNRIISESNVNHCDHLERVNTVVVSSDGQWIVSGSDDATVRVWDMESGQQLLQLSGQYAAVNSDRRQIITVSNKDIKVYDITRN
jgi:WD40 repeat protein